MNPPINVAGSFVSFSFFFFFHQHQSVQDLTSNLKRGFLRSYRFSFVLEYILLYKENQNLELLNLVNMTRLERELVLAELMKGPCVSPAQPPPTHPPDSRCLFYTSLLLSRRLSIHTGSTHILFGQSVFRIYWCFIKGLFWRRPLQVPQSPCTEDAPSSLHSLLGWEASSFSISYLAPRTGMALWSKEQQSVSLGNFIFKNCGPYQMHLSPRV